MNAGLKNREGNLVLSARGIRFEDETEFDYDLEPESIQKFWATVLAFAEENSADRVYFKCSDADDCMLISIDGNWQVLYPPPTNVRTYVFRYLLEVLLGAWRSRLLRYTGVLTRSTAVGRCVVQTDVGTTAWDVKCGYNWLAFERECEQ